MTMNAEWKKQADSLIADLDAGLYDGNLPAGMRRIADLWEGCDEYQSITEEQQMIIWRWIVSALFIGEQIAINGTVDVPNEDGGIDLAAVYSSENGSLSIYPAPLRFALANHIESLAFEKFGTEIGPRMAVRIYREMVEVGPNGYRISANGKQGLSILHDEWLQEINENGLPSVPTAH